MITYCIVNGINQAGIKLLIGRTDNCVAITDLRGESIVKINSDDSEYIVVDFEKTEKIHTIGGRDLIGIGQWNWITL